jgi:hypothetical protein
VPAAAPLVAPAPGRKAIESVPFAPTRSDDRVRGRQARFDAPTKFEKQTHQREALGEAPTVVERIRRVGGEPRGAVVPRPAAPLPLAMAYRSRSKPAWQAQPATPLQEPETTVHVSIGRIEVRAGAPAAAKPDAARRSVPLMDLDEYARRREGRGGYR